MRAGLFTVASAPAAHVGKKHILRPHILCFFHLLPISLSLASVSTHASFLGSILPLLGRPLSKLFLKQRNFAKDIIKRPSSNCNCQIGTWKGVADLVWQAGHSMFLHVMDTRYLLCCVVGSDLSQPLVEASFRSNGRLLQLFQLLQFFTTESG